MSQEPNSSHSSVNGLPVILLTVPQGGLTSRRVSRDPIGTHRVTREMYTWRRVHYRNPARTRPPESQSIHGASDRVLTTLPGQGSSLISRDTFFKALSESQFFDLGYNSHNGVKLSTRE